MWNGHTCSSPRSSTGSGRPLCAAVIVARVWQSVAPFIRTLHCMSVDAVYIAYMRPPHARELLSDGVLEQRDKKLQPTFAERPFITGIPRLPEGFIFTEWMRRADVSRSVWLSVCVWPPFTPSYRCHIDVGHPSLSLSIHRHIRPTGDLSPAARAMSMLARGWCLLSR